MWYDLSGVGDVERDPGCERETPPPLEVIRERLRPESGVLGTSGPLSELFRGRAGTNILFVIYLSFIFVNKFFNACQISI